MALSGHVPDLGALEVLLGVARTGSLNSAAQQIGVSQQAVSARIRAMEAQTGVPLVRRSPCGSALTPQGAVIAEWAARLLEVAAGLDAGIAALRADWRSRLRVSSSSTIAEQLLPAWLASFRAAAARLGGPAPDVVLTAVNSQTVIGHVTEGTADLGFIEGPRRPARLRSRVIGHDRLAVIVAPGHPWARRRCPGRHGKRLGDPGYPGRGAGRCPRRGLCAGSRRAVGFHHRGGPRGRAGQRGARGHQRPGRRR
jgi:molybdate transport repressor ModE-like protein